MKKPYLICHMLASLDGRIDCDMTEQICGNEYYEALEELNCPSMINGKTTAIMHYADKGTFLPKSHQSIDKETIYQATLSNNYHIITDTKGTLLWANNHIESKALICLVSEQVSLEYLDYLHQKKISYIATGKRCIDLPRAMEILADQFSVKRLVLTGGGHLNGSFLTAKLLNEISIMFSPGIDGRSGETAVFDGIQDKAHNPVKLKLIGSIKQYPNGTVWMRYLPI